MCEVGQYNFSSVSVASKRCYVKGCIPIIVSSCGICSFLQGERVKCGPLYVRGVYGLGVYGVCTGCVRGAYARGVFMILWALFIGCVWCVYGVCVCMVCV